MQKKFFSFLILSMGIVLITACTTVDYVKFRNPETPIALYFKEIRKYGLNNNHKKIIEIMNILLEKKNLVIDIEIEAKYEIGFAYYQMKEKEKAEIYFKDIIATYNQLLNKNPNDPMTKNILWTKILSEKLLETYRE